ncbi:MAG: PQQ-like beta-propeller repeat protein [Chloroflexaceae bacterium]|nr:PQQ-like beta-propeller repeat protein [Chloroflexaceae bacterium]
MSEEQQSRYLVDTLWMIRQSYPWVAGVFVWNLNFSVITEPGDEKAGFSILNPDWSIRPAYLTLQMNVNALQDIERPPFLSEGATVAHAWTFPGRGPMHSPPLLAPDGTLYAVSDPGTLYAVNPDGTLQWAYHASGMVSSAPARAPDPDGSLYLGDSSSLLTALHPDGSPAWTVRLRSPLRGSPVFHDEHIYGVTRTGEVVAFDQEGHEAWTRDLEGETTPLSLSSDGRSWWARPQEVSSRWGPMGSWSGTPNWDRRSGLRPPPTAAGGGGSDGRWERGGAGPPGPGGDDRPGWHAGRSLAPDWDILPSLLVHCVP